MFTRKTRILAGVAALGLTAALAACSTGDPLDGGGGDGDVTSISVGSQGFPESDILA